MSGERLGRLSLRLDAIYCLVLGVVVAVAAPLVESPTGLSAPLLLAIGIAAAGWGVLVWWSSERWPLRLTLRCVMVANLVASGALAVTGLVAGPVALMIGAAVLSIDVAAFAVSQGVALRRTRLETS